MLVGNTTGGFEAAGSVNAHTYWIDGVKLGAGGGGLVNVTGSPSSSQLTIFTGPTSISNGDLSGDTTTSGSLVTTTGKVHGVVYPASPTVNTVPVVTSAAGGSTVTYEAVPNAALANSSMTIGGQAISLGGATVNQGNGGKIQLSTGSPGTNDCAKFDANGNVVTAGAPCGTSSGTVTSVNGSSTGSTLTASGGPVTTSGTLNFELNLSHANTWLAVQTFTNSDIKLLGSSTGATTFTSANGSASNFTMTIPANSGTIAELNLAQTWTAAQTFINSDILLFGSSSGRTTFTSANSSATDYTVTIPANTGTLAELNLAQTWTALQSVSVETISAATSTLTPTGAKNDYAVTLVHANTPFTLANMTAIPAANTHGVIKIIQSSSGGDTIGTYGSTYQAPGGTSTIALSSGANAVDVFGFVSDGTAIYLFPNYNFSH